MEKLYKELNKSLADFVIFYLKLNQAHWLITGKEFFDLHKELEEMYDEVREHFDQVAERLLQLDQIPVTTTKQYQELTSLKECSQVKDCVGYMQDLLSDMQYLSKMCNDLIVLSNEFDDFVTGDIYTGIKAYYDKMIWMFKAYLK